MDFAQIQARALQVRERFAHYEKTVAGREWTREEIAAGLVVDLGDFMRLSMAKSGIRHAENIDDKLAHELADILWSVCVLAKEYDIDLQAAFLSTMDELEEKLAQKS